MREVGLVAFVAGCNVIFGIHDLPPADIDAATDGAARIDAARDAAPAVPALVQQASNTAMGATMLTTSFVVTPTAGHLLLMVGAASNTGKTAVTGGAANNAWVRASGSFTVDNIEIWYAIASATASDVTLTASAQAGAMFMTISEWSGIDAAMPFDTGSAATGSAGQTASAGPITTHQRDLIMFAASSATGSDFQTPPGMIALDPIDVGFIAGSWYEVEATAGSYDPGVVSPGDWDAAVAAFVAQ